MRLHLATRVGWGLFLGATVISLLFALGGVPVRELVRDPAAEYNYPAYGGLLSHLGIALMFGCTAICAFAATIASVRRNVLWGAAWLSLTLTLDDLFLLHEEVLPELLGLPEIILYLLYAAIAAWPGFPCAVKGLGSTSGDSMWRLRSWGCRSLWMCSKSTDPSHSGSRISQSCRAKAHG